METQKNFRPETDRKFRWWLLAIFATLSLTAIIPFRAISWTHEAQKDLLRSREFAGDLAEILSLMKDAETGQRGFIITGKDNFLAPYYAATGRVGMIKTELQSDAAGDADALRRLEQLFAAVDLKLAELTETIELRRTKGFAAAEPVVSSERGKQYMDRIRELISDQVALQARRDVELGRELEFRTQVAAYVGLASILTDLVMLAFVLKMMFRLLRERRIAAQALQQSTDDLNAGFAELEKRNSEIALMAQMARALESVTGVKETYGVIAIYCAKLLTSTGGALYLFRNSRDLLEREAQWGEVNDMPEVMEPRDCWALRQGYPHFAGGPGDLCCPHYHDGGVGMTSSYLCIPLIAQSEVLGLICLETAGSAGSVKKLPESENDLARAVSEQIALGLSNARLREVLQQQSIIDPLTGLFNRRYMDETLKREISRATRKLAPLSLIMLDIDHFKKVNDTYGHEMGDIVLAAVAKSIKGGIRDCDLACRYGGEELILILPDCDGPGAAQRAEKLREQIERLHVQHGTHQLNRITASFGVASYPADADNPDALIQLADQAMYNAKHGGRNRVVAARPAAS